jgi:hypothetical protein
MKEETGENYITRGFVIKCCWGDQIKYFASGGVGGGNIDRHMTEEKCSGILFERPKAEIPLERSRLGWNDSIIWSLRKECEWTFNGFIWLRTGTRSGSYKHGNKLKKK